MRDFNDGNHVARQNSADARSEWEAACGCDDDRPAYLFSTGERIYMNVRTGYGSGFQVSGLERIEAHREDLLNYLGGAKACTKHDINYTFKPYKYSRLSDEQILAVVQAIGEFFAKEVIPATQSAAA